MSVNRPRSCDTFAVLPPGTGDAATIVFGKNSDRPGDEVQEVVFVPARDHPQPSTVRCTYMEVEQVPRTHAVVLSKPSWMWGAEMGANEHPLCVGNEAVWTVLNDSGDAARKLLGMDLLRLALERARTAREGLDVIVGLLERYGMGGNCSDTLPDFTYHNSFLLADPEEVWVLECAGEIWAAECVVQGVRNISNELSIRTNIDLKCADLEAFAESKGYWNPGQGDFDFKRAFDVDNFDSPRYTAGKLLLTNYSKDGTFGATDMFRVLRDKPSGICMSRGSFVSTGSQVSVLRKPGSGVPSCHWFTATPDPDCSAFKPFMFGESVEFPKEVVSPTPLESFSMDRRYELYKRHESHMDRDTKKRLRELESKYVGIAEEIASDFDQKKSQAGSLFKNAVEEELTLYS